MAEPRWPSPDKGLVQPVIGAFVVAVGVLLALPGVLLERRRCRSCRSPLSVEIHRVIPVPPHRAEGVR